VQSSDIPHIEWPEGVSEAQKEALIDVLCSYDKAISDFENDHRVIFPSDSERHRLFFASEKKWSKQWAVRGSCMQPGCPAKSISRSHTIPMSASIKKISENGHVMVPRFREGQVEVVPVGIRDASTFPGFCAVHEAQFADFESKKQMTEVEHFYLQAFRTVCREIHTKHHHRLKTEEMLRDYRQLRELYMFTRLKQAKGGASVDPKSLKFDGDELEGRANDQIKSLADNLIELNKLCDMIYGDLKSATDEIFMVAANLDIELPVCLSGISTLHYRRLDVERQALCFIAIIPNEAGTQLIMGAAREHEEIIRHYMQDDTSPAVLERLESWMCHGSDHWFITPSEWEVIPQARKRAICDRILDTDFSIADSVEFSVLDGSRRYLLALAEAQLQAGRFPPEEVDGVRDLIDLEKRKLAWLPPS
jgi:hypothetical protein